MAWPDALRVGVKLCGALETAHRAGTLHRDIKPGNVLINDYGEPQLSDFGIARIAGGYETQTGFFTGTIAYTSPEVLAGNPPTAVADVYSLGATIYALIAGTAAHERKTDEDLIAHYLRISSTPVPDLRPEGIPADVCAAIEKAMSLDPAERQASAAEFGHELQAAERRNGLIPDSMALSERAGDETRHGQPARHQRTPQHVATCSSPTAGHRRRPVDRPATAARAAPDKPDAPTPHAAPSSMPGRPARAPTCGHTEEARIRKPMLIRRRGRRRGVAVGGQRRLLHFIPRQRRLRRPRPPRANRPPRRRPAGSRSRMRASPARRRRPPRPTAPSGSSAGSGRTAGQRTARGL